MTARARPQPAAGDNLLTVSNREQRPNSHDRGTISRRTLLLGSAAAGVGVAASARPANALTYGTKTLAEHRALPIAWGYPFNETATRGAGVDGYPGESYSGHIGIDLFTSPRTGVAVGAVAAGLVVTVGDDGEEGRGVYVVIDHGMDIRSEYLHLERGSVPVRIGQRVDRWATLGRTGWTGDVRPKTSSSAHLHLAILSGPYRGGVVWNPSWLIEEAQLPDGSYPISHPVYEEDTMAYPFHVDNKHLFMLAPGFVKHFSEYAPAVLTRDLVSSDGKWTTISAGDFLRQLDSFGVPRAMVDASQGRVYDVSTGQMAIGGMWSWAREAQQNTRAILAALNNRP